ncbi:MAG: TraR/DksA C4-type zinc finger protein [Acidobacteriia bacterium]|nr:TraR/DksA C4-type zinc finger protein [Terriglobia bacterium]
MDPGNVARYKRLLLAKQRELLAGRSAEEAPAPAAGHLLGDVSDQASAEETARVQARLRQTESHLLRAVEEALARIEQGSFGVCEACGRPISEARLGAVPWTRVCRECKESGK